MEYVEAMRPIVQKAGHMIMSRFRKDYQINYKSDRSIQTDVDLLSEDILKTELCSLLPGSGFMAEESKVSEIQEYTWVIDPIDGTKNFARGLPYFGINVALMHSKKVIAAVTYMPAMSDWFWAELGQGCWRNGERVFIGDTGYRQAGVLAIASDFRLRQAHMLVKIKESLKHIEHGVRFRVCGAAAVDLAYVAGGSYDVVLFENLKWWDAAAGVLLVAEAGGWVSQYDQSFVTPSFRSLIAGNPGICQLILPHL